MPKPSSRDFALGLLVYYATLIAGPVMAFAFAARSGPGAWGAGPGVGVVLIGIVPAAFANLAVLGLLRRRVEPVSAMSFIGQQALLGAICGAAVFAILSIESQLSLLGVFIVPTALSATAILIATRTKREEM